MAYRRAVITTDYLDAEKLYKQKNSFLIPKWTSLTDAIQIY